jgi:hypothetical protein
LAEVAGRGVAGGNAVVIGTGIVDADVQEARKINISRTEVKVYFITCALFKWLYIHFCVGS